MSGLRVYQLGAIAQSRVALREKNLRIVLYSPTGSGKTVMGEAFIRSAIAKGKRVAFIVNRIQLVKQTSKRFLQSGIQHGIIQSGNTCNVDSPVLICSIHTLASRALPPVDLIIIDEAHGVPGSTAYRKMIAAYNNVPTIGLTATPFSKGMGGPCAELNGDLLFHKLVVAATIRELIDMGFLVDCEIYAPSEPDLSGLKMQRNAFGEMDYAEKDLGKAVDKASLIGDIVTHWKRMANGKRTVCFATNISHSKHIAEQFVLAGVKAEHLDSYMEDDERAEIMKRVDSGETTVICNVAILTEGWDSPACECMILARPTKSLIRWVQMVGRILRPFPGKTHGIVLDHSGSTHDLGYPTEDLPLELCDGSSRMSDKKARDNPDVPPEPKAKKCPECHYMKPAGIHVCPKCSFAPERPNAVVTEDGELKLVDRSKKAELTKQNKQDVYSQLVTMQRDKGYSDGWTSNQYRTVFGVWPKGLVDVAKPVTDDVRKWVRHQQIKFTKGKQKQAGELRA